MHLFFFKTKKGENPIAFFFFFLHLLTLKNRALLHSPFDGRFYALRCLGMEASSWKEQWRRFWRMNWGHRKEEWGHQWILERTRRTQACLQNLKHREDHLGLATVSLHLEGEQGVVEMFMQSGDLYTFRQFQTKDNPPYKTRDSHVKVWVFCTGSGLNGRGSTSAYMLALFLLLLVPVVVLSVDWPKQWVLTSHILRPFRELPLKN